MSEIFKFFNSAPGDQRTYQAADFADYFSNVLSTGLLHQDNTPNLQVFSEGTSMQTYIEAGKAIIQGHMYENTDDLYVEHNLAESDMDRIDRIVLRLDKTNENRFIKLFVVTGTADDTPEPPNLTRDSFIHEISLAKVLIPANTSAIDPANITDERLDEDLCGLVSSLISVPTDQFEAEWDNYFTAKQNEVNQISSDYEAELQSDLTQYENEFNAWFDDLQENGYASQTDFETLQDEVAEHEAEIASDTKLGHVRIGNNLSVDENGVVSAESGYPQSNFDAATIPTVDDDSSQGYSEGSMWVMDDGTEQMAAYVCLDATTGAAVWEEYAINQDRYVDDTTDAPGPKILVGGDMQAGYFGEVAATELMTGSDLCSTIGLSEGTLQHSDEPYLKFAWKDNIQFINKKAIRNSCSWDAIATAGAVYGDGGSQGDAQVTINGLTYKVRLMRGAADDPTNSYDDADRGSIGPDNEWNALMLPIHINAPDSWAYPEYVDNPTEDWGVDYTDEDLLTHYDYGDGSRSWMQETRDTDTIHRVYRGGLGVSTLGANTSSYTASDYGPRFVLELVE